MSGFFFLNRFSALSRGLSGFYFKTSQLAQACCMPPWGHVVCCWRRSGGATGSPKLSVREPQGLRGTSLSGPGSSFTSPLHEPSWECTDIGISTNKKEFWKDNATEQMEGEWAITGLPGKVSLISGGRPETCGWINQTSCRKRMLINWKGVGRMETKKKLIKNPKKTKWWVKVP